jgi:hypothetical protein
VSNLVLSHVIKWFAANNLVLNLAKLNIMLYMTENSSHSTLHIGVKKSIQTVFTAVNFDESQSLRNC